MREHLSIAMRRVRQKDCLAGIASPAAALGTKPLRRKVPVSHIRLLCRYVSRAARRWRSPARPPQTREAGLKCCIRRDDLSVKPKHGVKAHTNPVRKCAGL